MSLLKPEIRKLIRASRRSVTAETRQQASLAAAKHFVQSSFFQAHQHLACYMAVAEEIDTLPIIQALWQTQKSCYLPVLSDHRDKKLRFARYEEGMKLTLNRHRVLEPQKAAVFIEASELEVVLLPLVAFDKDGNRLGTGGGYYDQTFAFRLKQPSDEIKKPHLLGLAYELQKVDKLPREDFDVPLDGVLTEAGLMIF